MKIIIPNSLTNMKEHIKELALNHAAEVLGINEDQFEDNNEDIEAIAFDFKSGVDAVLEHPEEFGLQYIH